jgi:hypothetical protein
MARQFPQQFTRADSRNADGTARLLALLLVFATVTFGFAGCMEHLAPDYDQSIVDGLITANEQTMTLFASISSGTIASSFPTREATYNSVIGEFDALRLEVMARPPPQPPSFRAPTADGKTPDAADTAPSARSLKTIVQKLSQMRKADQSGPMSAEIVGLYKNSYELSFSQVLTYEKTLKR